MSSSELVSESANELIEECYWAKDKKTGETIRRKDVNGEELNEFESERNNIQDSIIDKICSEGNIPESITFQDFCEFLRRYQAPAYNYGQILRRSAVSIIYF